MATYRYNSKLDVLNLGDIVYFGEEKSVVSSGAGPSYYLNFANQRNNYPFDLINIEDPMEWCRELSLVVRSGDFPQIDTLENLTLLVGLLYEKIKLTKTKITFANSLIDFIVSNKSKSKVCDIIMNNISDLNTDTINYLSDRDGEMLSYMPKGKPQNSDPQGIWLEKGRQKGKPAKIIRQIFTPQMLEQVTDKDFEIFANLYKASNDKKGKFKIVKGEEINKWYHESSYAAGQGQLNSSCMRYDNCSTFFGIYTMNPEIVSLLILVNEDDKLLGRAILWHTPEHMIMDRVYGTEATVEKFRMWAIENKYMYRMYNTNSNQTMFMNHLGKSLEKRISIELHHTDFDRYPYLDTFYVMDESKTFITNDDRTHHRYQLRNTGGQLVDNEERDYDDDDPDMVYCSRSGDRIHIDEARYIESIGDYVHEDYAVFCERSNEYILERDSFQCGWSGQTYHTDYMVNTIDGEDVYKEHDELVYLDDGRCCHEDDVRGCAHCGNNYYKDACIEIEDGIYVHEGHIDEYESKKN